jgi:hypothetical protein
MKRPTPQTPLPARNRLAACTLQFPADDDLNKVAEECHRRYLAGRWGSLTEASVAVVDWALYRLAAHPNFHAEHWGWIVAPDQYRQDGIYSRLSQMLSPAVGISETWRTSETDRATKLKEIDDAALLLLHAIPGNFRLDVGLRAVAGMYPEIRPVLDKCTELQSARLREIQGVARACRAEGRPIEFPPSPLSGVREPHLADYLRALRALIRGELKEARPSLSAYSLPEELEGDDGDSSPNGCADEPNGVDDLDVDTDAIRDFLGGERGGPQPFALQSGGDFGAYPNRKDALRRAVILASPRALFERMDDPPACPPAGVIEEACIAWFGDAPAQKDINAMIREQRAELEPRMLAEIRAAKKRAEEEARWDAAGLSEEERMKERIRSFIDDE